MRRPLALALLLLAVPAAAQPGLGLSDSARVSLLTMVPGDEVYSLWGHNALRIADPAAGIDRTYNYGTFTFEQPNFVLRFLSGRLDYVLGTAPFEDELARYRSLGRPIVEQRLDLAPETVRVLYDLLETNALPQNRAYRYDFLRDNCSTRLLTVLDDALAATGRPALTLPAPAGDATFRDLVEPYDDGQPLVDLGTSLGLGLPMDRVAGPREAVFLPDVLAAAADGATVGGRPLVVSRDTLFRAPPRPDRNARPWIPVGAWLAFALGVAATLATRRRAPGAVLRAADVALFAALGLAGTILLLLWVATEHTVTAANVELLWMWPTHVAFAVGCARAGLGRWRPYAKVAAVVTGLVLLAWVLLPEPMHPALVPVAALAAVRAAARAWGIPRATPGADPESPTGRG